MAAASLAKCLGEVSGEDRGLLNWNDGEAQQNWPRGAIGEKLCEAVLEFLIGMVCCCFAWNFPGAGCWVSEWVALQFPGQEGEEIEATLQERMPKERAGSRTEPDHCRRWIDLCYQSAPLLLSPF